MEDVQSGVGRVTRLMHQWVAPVGLVNKRLQAHLNINPNLTLAF